MSANKKQTLLSAEHKGRRFEVASGGPGVGYYLFVYEGARSTHDYLQDSIQAARQFAQEQFAVPQESWSDAQIGN